MSPYKGEDFGQVPKTDASLLQSQNEYNHFKSIQA